MLGLYLHVPFCRVRCSYCDFYLVVETKPGARERFVAALASEIRGTKRTMPLEADSVFFGGGTPSLLEPEEVSLLLSTCRKSFAVAEDAEISLEANPEDMTEEKARGFLGAIRENFPQGRARLNLGAQSFRGDALKAMMRPHDAPAIGTAFRETRRAGFDSIGLDLICGFPGDTDENWNASLTEALALAPDHLSLYLLEWHESTFLARQAAAKKITAPDDDGVAGTYERAVPRIEEVGLEHYEISNFARTGHASRHNLKYWGDEPYLGFGPGAHSYFEGSRRRNLPHITNYLVAVEAGESVPSAADAPLAPERRAAERLILALRKRAWHALDAGEFSLAEQRRAALEPFARAGCLEWKDGRMRLTLRGALLSNEIFGVLWGEEKSSGDREDGRATTSSPTASSEGRRPVRS